VPLDTISQENALEFTQCHFDSQSQASR